MYQEKPQYQYQEDACKPPAENEAFIFFRAYVDSKNEFDEACRNLAAAQQRKSLAEKHLGELNQRVMDIAQSAFQDPTVPQCASANSPILSGLRQRQ
jgi:hypothetical protein